MASRDEADPINRAHQADVSPPTRASSAQEGDRSGLPPPSAPSDATDKQFRLKLTIFWSVVIAAIVAAFATG